MTVGIFQKIIKEHNIPEDTVMLSDSGWECSASDMDAVYYNKTTNEMVFTQESRNKPLIDYVERYGREWVLIYLAESEGEK